MNDYIFDLISQGRYFDARNKIIEMNTVDIANLFEELDRQHLIFMFRILPKDIAAQVFSYASSDLQRFIIESIVDTEIKSIMDQLFLDDTIDFLEEMPSNVVKRVLENVDDKTRKLINQFLSYPENSAGSIMTIEYADLKQEMTAKEALYHIRKTGIDKETINTCYVLDSDRRLKGVVSIRKLILSAEDTLIKDIMDTEMIFIHTLDDQEEIAIQFKKYDLLSIPVVDKECRLVGIVTIDDIVDIIDKENTEDLQKMAAMTPSEKEYLKTSTFVLAKNRIFWLLFLMVSAIFSGSIIKKYNDAIESYVILASFIPMLMDTGGNAGSQSSTLIIRGMALNQITTKDFFKVLWKEIKVSFLIGIILTVVNFLRIYYIEKNSLEIALTVNLTLFAVVMLSKVIGGILPIIAKSLKLDPAIMAGPLITTIVDFFTLIIYFSLATCLLGI